jgi:hypothetical protein
MDLTIGFFDSMLLAHQLGCRSAKWIGSLTKGGVKLWEENIVKNAEK